LEREIARSHKCGDAISNMKLKFSEMKFKASTITLTESEGYVFIGFKTIADAVKQVELGFLGRFSR